VLRADAIHAIDAPASQDNLHSRLDLLRNLLEQRGNDRWKMPARSLAGTLLQPVIESGWLTDVKHLYLVPHGMLNYLPFALLPLEVASEQSAMIEHFTLSYLPAASSLANGNSNSNQPRTLLAMAPEISRLEYAPEEVRSIGELFSPGAQLLLGKDATESAFKTHAGSYQILHLATHGYFNKLNPLLSGLQLEADGANDGLLEVHEILELKLDSELVTLSACKTGLGSGYFSAIPAGDDFVGMTRAFLQVGSASVLATLWEVEDRSTVDLMKSFYGHLATSNPDRNKAGALASAQRALLTSKNYQHPYYWAPFVLVGSMSQNHKAQVVLTESQS
jgi:CHAT domain-containing protein